MTENGNNGPDNIVEFPKKKKSNIQEKFIAKFIDEIKSDDFGNAERNEIIREIATGSAVTPNIKSKLLRFQSDIKLLDSEFGEVDVEKINFFDLKRGVTRDFAKFQNTFSNYIAEITRNYEMSSKELSKIKSLLEGKSQKEIEALSKDIQLSEKFLKTEGKIELTDLQLGNLFSDMDHKDMEKRLRRIKPEKRDNVELALGKIANGNYTASDFKELFGSGFLSKQEELAFLRKYNTSISLKQAVDFGLISQTQAQRKKDNVIADMLSPGKTGMTLGADELNELKSQIDLRDIEVDVLDLGVDHDTLQKFVVEKDGLQKLDKEISNFKEDIEDTEKNAGPKNFSEFKKELSTTYREKVENLELFEKGNYFQLRRQTKEGTVNSIYEIIDTDNNASGFTVKFVGDQGNVGVDLSSAAESENYYYRKAIHLLKDEQATTMTFISKENMQQKVHAPNSDFSQAAYTSFNEKDLEDPNVKMQYMSKLEGEIAELKAEIESTSNEFKNHKKVKMLKETLEYKETRLKELQNSSGVSESLRTLNKEKLIADIDALDPGGAKFGLQKGLFLEADSGGVAEIYGVDFEKQQIIIKDSGDIMPLSFAAFYDSFQKHKVKRVPQYRDFGEFLEGFKSDGGSVGDNYRFVAGKFIAEKEGAKKEDQEVEYFLGKDGKELVKLESINGNTVTIRLGERKKEENKKKQKIEKLSLQKTTETISLNEFKKGLLDRKMVPNWMIGKDNSVIQEGEHPERKGSFGTRYMNGLSVVDILAAGKMFVENIEDTLKRGSDAASARAALKLGKYLPDDLRHNLQIKVEAFEAEETDKAVESLGKINSTDAVEKIRKWLLNKDTPAYKIEAGMLFMLENYGTLTAKGPLYPYRGQFLFYQALGGSIGDEIYRDAYEKYQQGDESFTEEDIVYSLVKNQGTPKGYKGMKRRSRLYKQIEGKRGAGIKEEVEKGYNDANNKNNVADMVDYGMGEAAGGTTANAVGALKKIIKKGGSLEQMSMIPFCLLYSGTLYRVDSSILNELKNLFDGEKMPIIMAMFCKDAKSITLARKTILEVANRVEQEYPGQKGIYAEALAIFNDATDLGGDEQKKFQRTERFYKNHGKHIIRALNMVDDDDSNYSKTDKIIFLEKERNPIFQQYYNTTKSFTEQGTFGADYMADACGTDAGVTGLNVRQNTEIHLKLNTSKSFADTKTAPIVWRSIEKDIISTKNKIFESGGKDVNSAVNKTLQRKYLREKLRQFTAGLRSNHTGELLSFYDKVGDMSISIRSWGLAPMKRFEDFAPEAIIHGDADHLLDTAIENILMGTSSSGYSNPAVDILKNTTQEAANDTIYKKRA